MNFQNAKIYTIRSFQTEKYYIGSTNQKTLAQRLGKHRGSYQFYLKHGSNNYVTSYEILQYDDHYIELLELFPCNSKDELHKREGELQRQYKNEIVNYNIAGRTQKEYYNDNIEHHKENKKEYYNTNKEHILTLQHEYYNNNKEQIKIYQNKYKETHKEQINEYKEDHKEQIKIYQKEYNQLHKEKKAISNKAYRDSHKKI